MLADDLISMLWLTKPLAHVAKSSRVAVVLQCVVKRCVFCVAIMDHVSFVSLVHLWWIYEVSGPIQKRFFEKPVWHVCTRFEQL